MHVLVRGSEREDVDLLGLTARGPGPFCRWYSIWMAPLQQLSGLGRVTRRHSDYTLPKTVFIGEKPYQHMNAPKRSIYRR